MPFVAQHDVDPRQMRRDGDDAVDVVAVERGADLLEEVACRHQLLAPLRVARPLPVAGPDVERVAAALLLEGLQSLHHQGREPLLRRYRPQRQCRYCHREQHLDDLHARAILHPFIPWKTIINANIAPMNDETSTTSVPITLIHVGMPERHRLTVPPTNPSSHTIGNMKFPDPSG